MPSAFEPWSSQFWRPFVQLPLIGAVDQSISPNWFPTNITVKGLGEQAFEQHIVSEVATYGKQLGELTDVVLALAKSIELEDCDALQELQVIAARINNKKGENWNRVYLQAHQVLKKLAESDPDEFSQLIATYAQAPDFEKPPEIQSHRAF